MTAAAAGDLPLETARLRLRAVTREDAPAIQTLVSERAVAEMTALIPHPYPPDGAINFIRALTPSQGLHLTIERADDGALLGMVSLRPLDSTGIADIGYFIGLPYWRQGYATEAVGRTINYGFAALGVQRYCVGVFAGNQASGRVLEKSGFVRIGDGEADFPVRGGRRKLWLYELARPTG